MVLSGWALPFRGSPQQSDPRLANVLAIGIERAGAMVASRLVEEGISGVGCIAVTSDLSQLKSIYAHEAIPIDGLLINPRASIEKLLPLFTNVELVFLIMALEESLAIRVASLIADYAKDSGALVIGISMLPYSSEHSAKNRITHDIRELMTACNTVAIIYDLGELGTLRACPLSAFALPAEDFAMRIVRGIGETFANPSLVNFDSKSFRDIIERGGIAHVGIGESSSTLRAEEATMLALRGQLARFDLSEAKGALIQVSGDDEMTFEEASNVVDLVSGRIHPTARLAWAARVDPSAFGLLRTTVLLTGFGITHIPGGCRHLPLDMYEMEPDSGEDEHLSIELDLDQIENY